ncbi:hypothetical protein HPB50_019814 [Hyalomma asiaticum]|uniref:Uncharacterized protein n=1 Tax=Hyalomma asiaticum TaxID=266040 RepID=A0ACB7RS04_HYAAI|nr:hypothetical protein HPB50_019814 [Hyalomma asiaticum]
MSCFFTFALVNVLYFNQLRIMFFSETLAFTKWLQVIVFSAVCIKVAVNVFYVVFRSRKVFDFFKDAAIFEASVNFVPPKCCRQPAGRYVFRLLQTVAFVGNVGICSYVVYGFIDHHVSSVATRVVLKILCVAGNFLFYVYQMVEFIVLRPCIEVLLLYIRQQHDGSSDSHAWDGDGSIFVNRDNKVQEIRLNLCSILL